MGEAGDAANHPAVHSTAPATENDLSLHVSMPGFRNCFNVNDYVFRIESRVFSMLEEKSPINTQICHLDQQSIAPFSIC